MTFDLWIWKTRNGFESNADSKVGGAGPVFFSAPLGALDIQSFYGGVRESAGKSARSLGHRLFELVFQGEVREKYHSCRRMAEDSRSILRLRLNLQDPELWKWPWECLYDEDFLALSPIISLVRRSSILRPVSSARFSLGSRAVIVAASPGANQKEVSLIERAMRRSFDLTVLTDPNLEELQAMLVRPVKVLHFLGRTAFMEDPIRRSGEQGLVGFFGRLRSPSLIVLNGQDTCQPTPGYSVSDLAPRVARAGAPSVLAMHLPDELAGDFIQVFYESLASGQSLESAVRLARHGLAMHNQGAFWSNPALYLQKEWRKGIVGWHHRALMPVRRHLWNARQGRDG